MSRAKKDWLWKQFFRFDDFLDRLFQPIFDKFI